MSSLHNIMDLCRLCLVKEKVSVPIFDGEGDTRQIFVKIAACLPVKVERNDKLPKKICDTCLYKVENVYQFWNTTANSEKQLRQWLGEASKSEDSSSRATALETDQLMLKVESIDADQVSEHGKAVSHERDPLRRKSDEESASEDEDEGEGASSSEDTLTDCGDVCDGPSKEEADSEEDGYGELEPTTFVNVSMACEDQAGPSGLHQAEDEHAEITSELSNVDTLSTGQQDQSKPGTAPSTSEVVPVPSGFPTGFIKHIWGDATNQKASSNSNAKGTPGTGKRRYVKSGKYSKKKKKVYEEDSASTAAEPAAARPKQGERDAASAAHTCGECGLKFDAFDELDKHMEEHEGRENLQCTVCGKAFATKKILKRHLIVHSQERPYNCDICHKTFKRPYDITIHKKKHTGENKHECDLCDYSTIYRSALATHRKRHFEEFKYRCEICGKGFFVLTWLEEHRNFHTGEKPFQCDVCGKAFPYTRYLVAHKKANHPDAQHPPKVNRCDTCGKVFAHKKSLSLHVKSHTGENVCLCDICGKALTNREHLKFHRRIHTGEKPNVCAVCGKAFSKRCNLKLHERTHTGERPYTCDTCGKSFTQRSTLVIHKRYHTGQRPYVCHLCQKGFVCKALLNAHQKSKCI